MDPSVDLTVLEAEETLGGTWCAAQVFPGLLANRAIGAYEYANKPIPNEGMAQYGCVPADKIHAYLIEYAREWGVYDKIRFRTSVESVYQHEDGRRWVVRLKSHPSSTDEPQISSSILVFDKVIFATGPLVHSSGAKPRFILLRCTVIHSKDIGSNMALFESTSGRTRTQEPQEAHQLGRARLWCRTSSVYSCHHFWQQNPL